VPGEACAFAIILRLPDARERFQQIFDSGTLAGQVYALCGLYLTYRSTFDVLVRDFGGQWSALTTQSGCIVQSRPLGEVLDELRSGELPRRLELLATQAALRNR